MKHGLILTGTVTKNKDKEAFASRFSEWKSIRMEGDSFFVTDQTFKANFFMKRLVDSVMNGLKACEEAGLMYCYIFDYSISIPETDILIDLKKRSQLTSLSFYGSRKIAVKTKQLDHSFMFGKTATLKELWKEMPLNPTDISRNIFKGVSNLAGCNLQLASIITPDELGIKRRIV